MVDFNLQPGVRLHVEPTSRFHVNRILINFATPQTAENSAARNLLANLLETSTAAYPTQTAFAKALNHLYGADPMPVPASVALAMHIRCGYGLRQLTIALLSQVFLPVWWISCIR